MARNEKIPQLQSVKSITRSKADSRGGGGYNHSYMYDHLEAESPAEGADLRMASSEVKANDPGTPEENVSRYLDKLCFVLWR